MSEKTEIIINADGTFSRRYTSEETVLLGEEIAASLSEGVSRVTRDVFALDDSPCHISRSEKETYVGTRLRKLTLNCPWQIRDNVLTPAFCDKELPQLRLEWVVPSDMAILFVARVAQAPSIAVTKPDKSCFIAVTGTALGDDNKCYLPPLPNIYDDSYICMGEFNGRHTTVMGAFELALNQFKSSPWNADLFNSDKQEKSNQLFRFEPKDGNSYRKIAPSNWRDLCYRCENRLTEIATTLL